ncbi:hypothetical protein H109_06689 [Trichophyton interdigitale MR816]|uniref:Uncharacterized protein n=1 Tax=Trichophyton interdigitale (strain MR816) TaxID=1215338 RepID=A0A059J108_TRIIM|nr:hypothetical protein H101_07571 [Trichophyton interdigitale H6]KDB21363.1 hypothetical protein H109_06689 [Trichophyton interdigitale MR816]
MAVLVSDASYECWQGMCRQPSFLVPIFANASPSSGALIHSVGEFPGHREPVAGTPYSTGTAVVRYGRNTVTKRLTLLSAFILASKGQKQRKGKNNVEGFNLIGTLNIIHPAGSVQHHELHSDIKYKDERSWTWDRPGVVLSHQRLRCPAVTSHRRASRPSWIPNPAEGGKANI